MITATNIILKHEISKKRGFTLIELLIVVTIIGILSAIAVPAYIGQREKAKARTVGSSAKGAVAEIQSWLDLFLAAEPFIALTATGLESCFESPTAPPKKRCSVIYPNVSTIFTYSLDDLDNLIAIAITHHAGQNEYSPYNLSQSLFTDTLTEGSVVLTSIGSRSIRIHAYTSTTTSPIFETMITAR